MIQADKCLFCKSRKIIKFSKGMAGVKELQVNGQTIVASDTSILYAIEGEHKTTSEIKNILDKEFFASNQELIFGGRTDGNIRSRLRVLTNAGLVVGIFPTATARIPKYEITSLGQAVKNFIIGANTLLNSACASCMTEKSKALGGYIHAV